MILLPHLPYIFGWHNISLIETHDIKAVIWECKIYFLKDFKALTKAYACFTIIFYFIFAFLRYLLKNKWVFFSWLSSFFCNKRKTMVCVAAATCFPNFSLLLKLRDPSLSLVARTHCWKFGVLELILCLKSIARFF